MDQEKKVEFCYGCSQKFPKIDLRVCNDGSIWCLDCLPNAGSDAGPILVSILFSWPEIVALQEYLDGDISPDILEWVDEANEQIKLAIYTKLKELLRKENGS
jgi:hypothetical protein